jgi:Copper amine oxidase, enzyme domain
VFDADDDTIPWFPANEWTKHNAYVTVRHEVEERGGWPQFDMQGPSDPIQPFSSYTNAETLDGEDLVLWIVHGVIHCTCKEKKRKIGLPRARRISCLKGRCIQSFRPS